MDTLLLKGHRTLEGLLRGASPQHGRASRDEGHHGKFLETLLRDWDPNRDGTINKMEFRQDVASLCPEPMSRMDRLFESFVER